MPAPQPPLCPPPDYLPPALLDQARPLALARGEHLFRQDDPVRHLYFVQAGELKAIRPQLDGSQAVMLRGRAGEFFAESALATTRYVCHAEAVCPSRVLAFPADAFRAALAEDGELALTFALAMAAHARRQCSRQERLRLKRARERVLHLLTCEADNAGRLVWRAPLAEMAEELALEPETLYRTLGELEQEGIIERERRVIRLRQPGCALLS